MRYVRQVLDGVSVAKLMPGKRGDMSNDNPNRSRALNSQLKKQHPTSTGPTQLAIEQFLQTSSLTLLMPESCPKNASFSAIGHLCTFPGLGRLDDNLKHPTVWAEAALASDLIRVPNIKPAKPRGKKGQGLG